MLAFGRHKGFPAPIALDLCGVHFVVISIFLLVSISHLYQPQSMSWFERTAMMPFLVVKHITLVVVSVLAAIPALESLLTHVNVHLVGEKRWS